MRTWDIFCKVIDNLGDIGVCWRLSADLASRGQQVRLWADDPSALTWMAPGALEGHRHGIEILPWESSRDARILEALPPADIWVEGFGCEPAPEFVAHRFAIDPSYPGSSAEPPLWINLEYLSAEAYAARSHGLASPIMQGPAKDHTRFFFYPGLTPATGGLLREPALAQQQQAFDRSAWLASHSISWSGERLIALFCYEPAHLPALLEQWRSGPDPTHLLVTPGRAAAAVVAELSMDPACLTGGAIYRMGALALSFLPPLAQPDFDRLLWACDWNFVRGEDSLVRALWAGKPFVWQIYPQQDDAHHAKLLALLDALGATDSWRDFHLAWNGIRTGPLPTEDLPLWGDTVARAARGLAQHPDLTTRLLKFVDQRPVGFGFSPKKS